MPLGEWEDPEAAAVQECAPKPSQRATGDAGDPAALVCGHAHRSEGAKGRADECTG